MAIVTFEVGKLNPSDVVATLDTETGELVISGEGEMADVYKEIIK